MRNRAVAGAAVAIACVFAVNVAWHAFLSDDAFISFRYANHFVQGQGLAWNPGEFVEGYSNFLWVVMMAGAMRLGIAPEVASNVVGVASGALVLVLIGLGAYRSIGPRWAVVLLAPLCLALNRSFAAWSTGGLETMWFTFLVGAATWTAIVELESGDRLPLRSSVLFGLATLTRPEGALFWSVTAAWRTAATWRSRQFRSTVIWCVPFLAIVIPFVLWRHAYYGAWLPNTFLAKVPAAWWEQGLRYAYDFSLAYGIPLLALLGAIAIWRRPNPRTLLLAAHTLAYAVYVVAIGGDRFEFRFWIPVLPSIYLLAADGIAALELRSLTRSALLAVPVLVTLHGSLQDDERQLPDWHGIAPVAGIAEYASSRMREGRVLRELIERGDLPRDLVVSVTGAGALPYYTDWIVVDRHGLNDRFIASLPVPSRAVILHDREAPLAYLESRGVVIDDALNGVVYDPAELPDVPLVVQREGRDLPIRVAEVGGYILAFASFVPDDELAGRLGRARLIR